MYTIIKTRYKQGKITAAEVWAYVDTGKITHDQAVSICGARPA